jgi:hypothetical protein
MFKYIIKIQPYTNLLPQPLTNINIELVIVDKPAGAASLALARQQESQLIAPLATNTSLINLQAALSILKRKEGEVR